MMAHGSEIEYLTDGFIENFISQLFEKNGDLRAGQIVSVEPGISADFWPRFRNGLRWPIFGLPAKSQAAPCVFRFRRSL